MVPVQLATLLRLRHRLLWAQARSRRGRIVLLAFGYFLALCLIGLLALGGLSAAMGAIRLGRSEFVASVALAWIFVTAVLAAALLGAGVRDVASDQVLRRYPMSGRQRSVARHVVTFVEPTWLFVLATEIGLAVGFGAWLATSIWLSMMAIALLVLINYVTARIVVGIGERLMASRSGALAAMIVTGLLPIVLVVLWRFTATPAGRGFWLVDGAYGIVALLPTSAAARILTQPASSDIVGQLAVLGVWGGALIGALAALERYPARRPHVPRPKVTGNSLYDIVARLSGRKLAPLVGKALRCYARSPQVRYHVPIVVALLVQMQLVTRLPRHAVALAGMMLIGMSTGGLSLNVFGFDGAGFRRYWLMPVSPRTVLIAHALVALLPGLMLLPVVLVTLLLITPSLAEPRLLILLAASGLAGIFTFQGIGLWTSVLSPCAIPFYATWSPRWSPITNGVAAGAVITCVGLTWRLSRSTSEGLMAHWWLSLPVVALTVGFYLLSVWVNAVLLAARRERVISTIEGLA